MRAIVLSFSLSSNWFKLINRDEHESIGLVTQTRRFVFARGLMSHITHTHTHTHGPRK